MEINESELTDRLTNKLVESNLAVFAGAGLSVQAGLPNWSELFARVATSLGLDIERETDMVALAQYFVNENAGRKTPLNDHILSEIGKDRETPAALAILARLPISTYWTTNFDCLIENALREARKRPQVIVASKHVINSGHGAEASVFKMHGDINNVDSLVVTRDDYESYATKRPLMLNILCTDLLSKTFVFLGFSFTDPNFRYLAGRLRAILGGEARTHYWVEAYPSKHAEETDEEFKYRQLKQSLHVRDLKRLGIQTVMVEHYDEITSILGQLEEKYQAVCSRRSDRRSIVALSELMPLSSPDASARQALKSPCQGTFYASERSENRPIVTAGDLVEIDQPLCIIESNQRFVSLTSPCSGYVEEVMSVDSAKVLAGQDLFVVLPIEAPDEVPLFYQKAEITGRFYRAPYPKHEPFVREGHIVNKGSPIGTIEVAKLYNDVVADQSGVIVKLVAKNGDDVMEGNTVCIIDAMSQTDVAQNQKRPYRVTVSSHRGRFYPNEDGAPRGSVKFSEGQRVRKGEILGRIKRLRKSIPIVADFSATFFAYLAEAGSDVEIDQPLFGLIPEVIGPAYRILLSEYSGAFSASVEPGEDVRKGDVVGQIKTDSASLDVKCEYTGKVRDLVVTDGTYVAEQTLLLTIDV